MACHFLFTGGIADRLSGNLLPQPDFLAALLAMSLAPALPMSLRRMAPPRQRFYLPVARPPDLRPPKFLLAS
jgi:hypothetical protein